MACQGVECEKQVRIYADPTGFSKERYLNLPTLPGDVDGLGVIPGSGFQVCTESCYRAMTDSPPPKKELVGTGILPYKL